MSFVGNVEFHIMRGMPQQFKQTVETWRVPGLDGYGAQTLGQGDAEFELETVAYFFNNAAANATIDASEAMQGTVVNLVDDFGDEYDSALVTNVQVLPKQPCIKNGITSAIRLTIRWKMVFVEVP